MGLCARDSMKACGLRLRVRARGQEKQRQRAVRMGVRGFEGQGHDTSVTSVRTGIGSCVLLSGLGACLLMARGRAAERAQGHEARRLLLGIKSTPPLM